jgi:hypothetical protein
VGHADRLDRERPQREPPSRQDLDQLGVVQQVVLVQLALHQGQGELRAIHRHVQLGEDPGQSADVVLVPVRQDDAAHLLAVLGQVADVGHHDVNAQQFFFRKHEAGVDDDDLVLPAQRRAVHAELAQAPKGDNA